MLFNRTFAILISLALSLSSPAAAQKKNEVYLKYSRHEGVMRIVLEGEETFVGKTQVAVSAVHIKIDFPDLYHLNTPGTLPFDAVQSEKSLMINPREKGEIKSFRLSQPARIVFDVHSPDIHADKQASVILSNSFVLDAGHGGYEFGMTSKDVNEKDINLQVAQDLGAALSKKGKKVFFTRRVDQNMSLAERISFANQKKPDAFISLHCSSSASFGIYVSRIEGQASNEMLDAFSLAMRQKRYLEKSKALAESIGKAFKEEFKSEVVRRDLPLPVLNSVSSAAVLIEIPSPGTVVYDQKMRTRVVNAIAKGLALYGQ